MTIALVTEPPVLETKNLAVRFGGHVAVDDVSCAFACGTLTAIVGPNGAGKTTYFNLISGQIASTSGSILLNGQDITRLSVASRTRLGLGRAFQLTNLFPGLTVRENVRLVVQAVAGKGFDLFRMAENARGLIAKAEHVLAEVKLLDRAGATAASLSHGDQRKLEVALLIALEPDVMMFDEPTAGMSVDEVPVILDLIAQLKSDPSKTILLVEHKMDVIRSLADRVVVLHNGGLVADGRPAEVMASSIVQDVYLGTKAADVPGTRESSAHA